MPQGIIILQNNFLQYQIEEILIEKEEPILIEREEELDSTDQKVVEQTTKQDELDDIEDWLNE